MGRAAAHSSRPIVWLLLLAVALALPVRAVGGPELPPLPAGAVVVVHLDLTKADLNALGGAMPVDLRQYVDALDQKLKEATLSGVRTATIVATADHFEGDQPPMAYVGIKPDANQPAVETMLRDLVGDDAGRMTISRVPGGGFLLMQAKPGAAAAPSTQPTSRSATTRPAAPPPPPTPARAFTDAFAKAGTAPLVAVFIPTPAMRQMLRGVQVPADAPAPIAQILPPLAKAKSVTLAVTLGATPALSLTLDAADPASAQAIAARANEMLDIARQMMAQGAGGDPKATQLIKAMTDAWKPTQAGSEVKIALDRQAIGLSTAILLPALTRAKQAADEVKSASNIRHLGIAVQLYSNEHFGAPPERLDELKAYMYADDDEREFRQVLTNPRSGDKVGYIYVKPGAKLGALKDPAATPMFYESLNGKKNETGLIGYADGHVGKGGRTTTTQP